MKTAIKECTIRFNEAELRRLIEAMKSYRVDKDAEELLERLRYSYGANFKTDPSL